MRRKCTPGAPALLAGALLVLPLAACVGDAVSPPAAPESAVRESAQPAPAVDRAVSEVRQLNWAWDCEDGRNLVSSERDGVLSLFVGGPDRRSLRRVPAASGAKYEGEGVLFWTHGDEARFELDGVVTTCRVNAFRSVWEDAKLRGADFRAVGNEPGWHLELFSSEDSLLVTDYGNRRIRFTAAGPEPLEPGPGSVFIGRADGVDIYIELTPGPCADSMADIDYETTVVVQVGNRLLRGCGNALH